MCFLLQDSAPRDFPIKDICITTVFTVRDLSILGSFPSAWISSSTDYANFLSMRDVNILIVDLSSIMRCLFVEELCVAFTVHYEFHYFRSSRSLPKRGISLIRSIFLRPSPGKLLAIYHCNWPGKDEGQIKQRFTVLDRPNYSFKIFQQGKD